MIKIRSFALALSLFASPLAADTVVIADLALPQDSDRWRFFTDGVMGGVSTGQAVIDKGALTITGDVSTDNNGGFIQARLSNVSLPPDATRITARVKGNGQTYFLHLRTDRTVLPWHYYQAAFTAAPDWSEVSLALSDFEPSHRVLPDTPAADSVQSIALVAYGRDHQARVSLSRLSAE